MKPEPKTKPKAPPVLHRHRRNSVRHLKGLAEFLAVMDRLASDRRLACFCTPGHNRGAAFWHLAAG
jgi:hypothetical protein